MAISNKHKFTSPKADGADASLVRPSNWNDEHDLTMDSGFVLGRTSAGNGPVEETKVTTALIDDGAVTTAKIGDGAVTNAKHADMAEATVKGREAGSGTGAPVDLTAAQLAAIIPGGVLRGAPVVITSSGTYTPDAEVKSVIIEALGGGAGGESSSGSSGSGQIRGSGGAGGYCQKFLSPPVTLTITIGAGGSAASVGGNTTVTGTGVSLAANGGQRGGSQNSTLRVIVAEGGRGGTASGGDINYEGQSGTGAMANAEHDNAHIGTGGSTKYGSGGRSREAQGTSVSGLPGQGFGSGGSGCYEATTTGTARTGGAGANGVVVIWEFN